MFLNGEYGHKSSAVHRSGYICRPFQQRIGVVERATGCSSARLECYVRDVEAGGSNPLTPTVQSPCNAVAGAFSWKAKPSGAGARAFHERAREQSEPGGALGAPPLESPSPGNPLTPTVQSPCNAVAGAFSWVAQQQRGQSARCDSEWHHATDGVAEAAVPRSVPPGRHPLGYLKRLVVEHHVTLLQNSTHPEEPEQPAGV